MNQSIVNRVFGTIFAGGLAFVILLSLYSTFPLAATREASQMFFGDGNLVLSSAQEGQETLTTTSKYPMTFMPPIGLGTWLSKPDEVTGAVKYALDIGYRHIDGAKAYRNEKEVGKGIALSGIPRNEIWLTSKLFNDDHHPDDVEPAIRRTLSDLGVEYLDLYLMHWPLAIDNGTINRNISFLSTYLAMESLVSKGLTKNIGISNFAQHQVETILSHCHIRPAAHEFELHPYLQQSSFVSWHLHQGIQVIAYSPFANLNPTYHSDLPPELSKSILEDPFWRALAARKNASVPQAVLAWAMQRGTIPIPKSVHEEYIRDNWEAKNRLSTELRFSEEEMKAVEDTDRKARFNVPFKGEGLFEDLDSPDGVRGSGVEIQMEMEEWDEL